MNDWYCQDPLLDTRANTEKYVKQFVSSNPVNMVTDICHIQQKINEQQQQKNNTVILMRYSKSQTHQMVCSRNGDILLDVM